MKYHFDEQAADDVIFFIENLCTHVKGDLAGKPLILEEWQKEDIIKPIFGWKRPDETRRYRTAYIEVPRKNAKSTLCAAIQLYLLVADGEKGAEIYCAAAARDQVASVFDPCKEMVNQSSHLSSKLSVFRNSITVNHSASFLKAISADAKTKHGFNASGVVIDELHVQPDRDLHDVLTTSVGSRRQPLVFMITTAGYNRTSICWEQHEYSRKIDEGIIKDDSFFGLIYSIDEGDDWEDEEVWKKANPGYGTIVKKDYFKEQYTKAKNEPSFLNTFKNLHLNIWTSSHSAWIPDHDYMKCDMGGDLEKLKGRRCVAGLDLGSTRDLTALVLLFPSEKDDKPYFDVVPFFWCAAETAETRGNKGGVDYLTWAEQKHLTLTPGNTTDYNFIKKEVSNIVEKYDLKIIGYDQFNSSQLIIDLIDEYGSRDIEFRKFSQGVKDMSPPTIELERIVLEQRMDHYGHPILRWMFDNVMIFRDANDNIKLNKKKATEKIDGVVALVMALGEYMTEDNFENEMITEITFI